MSDVKTLLQLVTKLTLAILVGKLNFFPTPVACWGLPASDRTFGVGACKTFLHPRCPWPCRWCHWAGRGGGSWACPRGGEGGHPWAGVDPVSRGGGHGGCITSVRSEVWGRRRHFPWQVLLCIWFIFHFFSCVADLQVSAHTWPTQPPRKMEAQLEYVQIGYMVFFACLVSVSYAQLVLINKISALERDPVGDELLFYFFPFLLLTVSPI